MKCAHTMRVGQRDGSIRCGDCGKLLKKAPKLQTMTLKGAAAHRFCRVFDPTFPLHPDEIEAPQLPDGNGQACLKGE